MSFESDDDPLVSVELNVDFILSHFSCCRSVYILLDNHIQCLLVFGMAIQPTHNTIELQSNFMISLQALLFLFFYQWEIFCSQERHEISLNDEFSEEQ